MLVDALGRSTGVCSVTSQVDVDLGGVLVVEPWHFPRGSRPEDVALRAVLVVPLEPTAFHDPARRRLVDPGTDDLLRRLRAVGEPAEPGDTPLAVLVGEFPANSD